MGQTMKTEAMSIRLDEDDKADLIAICAERDLPVSQVIRGLVRDWLKYEKAKAEKARQKGKK